MVQNVEIAKLTMNLQDGRIVGDLTIGDITQEVALDVEYSGQMKSPWGAINMGSAPKPQSIVRIGT
jgi:polyisoprenoid-binding protein YceI